MNSEEIKTRISLKDFKSRNEQLLKENKKLQSQISGLKKHNEEIIDKKVEKRTQAIQKEFEKKIAQKDKELEEKNKQIEALKAELAKTVSKYDNDSTNSGIPTSKTPLNKKKYIPNTRVKSDKPVGGQQGHKKHKLEVFTEEEATEIVEEIPVSCPKCQSKDIKVLDTGKNKCETDYEVKLIKRIHKFQDCECNECHQIFHKDIPNNLKEDNQYGTTLQSLCVCLTNEIYTPFNKTVKLVSGITNGEINMSEGYVTKLQKKASSMLETFIDDVKKYILNQPVYGWDEGVITVNTKEAVLRVYVTDKVLLIIASESKSKDSVDKDGILINTKASVIVIHDHNILNYNEDYVFKNCECLIHLIRRLRKMEDNTKQEYLREFITFLSETNKERNRLIADNQDKFSPEEEEKIKNRYEALLKKGFEENEKSTLTENYFKKEELTLLNDLKKYQAEYLRWVENFGIPSTNNSCESAIRPVKSKQKISGQFKNIEYAKYYANIRTYIEICKRNDINIIEGCKRLMEGNPYTLEEILKNSQSSD